MICRRRISRTVSTGLVVLLALAAAGVFAQYDRRRDYGRGRYERTLMDDRGGVPEWEVDRRHRRDVFTFVRVRYSDGYRGYGGYRRGYRGGGKWRTDYPDSDLNFSYRLQQLTSMQVDPQGKILDLTDPELFDYPFLYLIEPGRMSLSPQEVESLRKYLLRGGFMMVDDFWGEDEWRNFYLEIKRVFPDREPKDLELDHPIFHCVYDLKEKPQIPSIHAWWGGMTTERWDATEPHYRAIFDDKERMMMIICHNTDLGDGWEREGLDPEYFRLYSERWSYPLGINIVVYAMTH